MYFQMILSYLIRKCRYHVYQVVLWFLFLPPFFNLFCVCTLNFNCYGTICLKFSVMRRTVWVKTPIVCALSKKNFFITRYFARPFNGPMARSLSIFGTIGVIVWSPEQFLDLWPFPNTLIYFLCTLELSCFGPICLKFSVTHFNSLGQDAYGFSEQSKIEDLSSSLKISAMSAILKILFCQPFSEWAWMVKWKCLQGI